MVKPIVNFSVLPNSIVRGKVAILRYQVFFATSVHISGIGYVSPVGIRLVYPTSTTTYRLTALSADDETVVSIILTVREPDPPTYGGKITLLRVTTNPVAIGGNTSIQTRVENTGSTTEQFTVNIFSGLRGAYWSDWKFLPPGGTFDFSRSISNVQIDQEMRASLWRWTGTTSVLCQTEGIWIFVESEPRYALNVETSPGNCRLELYDSANNLLMTTTSGSGGDAFLGNLERGTYVVHASKDGYTDARETVNLDQDKKIWIVLTEETVWDWIIGFVILGIENVLGIQEGSLLTILGRMGDLITNFFGDIYDFFSDVVGSVVDIVTESAGALFDWISDSFLNFIDWLGEIGGDIADYIGGAIDDAVDWLGDAWGNFTDMIGEAWKNVTDYVGEAVDDAVDWITSGFEDFVDWLGEIGGSIADYIGNAIGDAVDWLGDAWGDFTDMVGEAWKGVTDYVGGAIGDAFDWISEGFMDFVDWLGEIVGDVADYIGTAIGDAVDFVLTEIPGIVEGMFEWAQGLVQPVIDAVGFLGELLGIVTRETPEPPEIRENIERRDEIQKRINDKVKEL